MVSGSAWPGHWTPARQARRPDDPVVAPVVSGALKFVMRYETGAMIPRMSNWGAGVVLCK